ncbi:MAG TPA: DNA/RNA non-specific endonuclease, partial [Gemmatales bacterium]|nr:DNA/RNA non-specific endonuclease [Gemmatales bacterium]
MGFKVDPETSSAIKTSDYDGCGYSRGHMAPSFAMSSRFGAAGARSTFVMSNVCPQFQSHNSGQWGSLEALIAGRKGTGEFVKGWADTLGEVWVVVGPVFGEAFPPLKKGDVAVPSAFYCIVVDEVKGKPRMLAFLMKHEDEKRGNLVPFLTSVDKIEALTGLNFFSELPDSIEDSLEQQQATELWATSSK